MDRNGAPIAIRDPDGHSVVGELYVVPDENLISVIDPMEGHPDVYRREAVSLQDFNPGRLPVYMYIYQHGAVPDEPVVRALHAPLQECRVE